MRILTTFFIAVGMIAAIHAANRPNFVWIISEDNSIHYLDHFFAGGADTPHIKSLATHGITYDHAFSHSPVCSVARSTLITGCYAPRIGTQYHRRSAMAPMPEGVRMFPAYLRAQQGYFTTNRSKTDYNAKPGKGVWDESSNKAHWRKRKPGQPFFHKASYPISHESSLHFNVKSMQSQPTRHDPEHITLAPYHPDTPTFRYTHARYLDNIVKIDGVVGQVVAQLKEDGVLEDTFIFYFGDHGGVLPRSKGYAYESGLHIPLVVRVPENFRHLVSDKLGSRQKGFVGFIDFGPTVLNLAGIKIPGNIDGRPFLGEGAATREFAFGYADRFDEKYDLVRWIRKGRFSYQRNYQPFNFDSLQNDYRYKQLAFREWRKLFHEGKLNAIQRQFFEPRSAEALFDLKEDPHEVNNLAGDTRYSETLVNMRHLLHEHVTGINDLSLFPEPYMVREAMQNPAEFGRSHSARVARLVDIADLQLIEFSKAKEGIESALQNKDPWARYWGCIVASAHGQAPQELADLIEILALDDPEPLVRCRAAEFLGLTTDVDPRPIIKAALKMSQSAIETNLILNTAVLLQDGSKRIQFNDLTKDDVNHSGRYVAARLAYLSGGKPPIKLKKK